jgi:hypothetical protein
MRVQAGSGYRNLDAREQRRYLRAAEVDRRVARRMVYQESDATVSLGDFYRSI